MRPRAFPLGGTGPERKFIDRQRSWPSGTAFVHPLLGYISAGPEVLYPAQGQGQSQRIGRVITVKSLHWRGRARLHKDSQLNPNVMLDHAEGRLIIGIDTQCNGVGAEYKDVLNDTAGPSSTTVQKFRNLDNAYRFKILHDKHFVLFSKSQSYDSTNNIFWSSVDEKVFSGNIRLNMKIHGVGSGGELANISDNCIVAWVVFETSLVSGNIAFRMRYTDS